MEKKLKELEKIIKYEFKRLSLLKRALTHKSLNNEINNEKLEFLGDRVLGLVISETLLEKYPDEKEGIIDKKFANLVNKKTCSLIAKKINLKKFILLGSSHRKLERSADKIISDCLEALVGAIYLDGGLKSVQKFIFIFWEEYLLKSTIIDKGSIFIGQASTQALHEVQAHNSSLVIESNKDLLSLNVSPSLSIPFPTSSNLSLTSIIIFRGESNFPV